MLFRRSATTVALAAAFCTACAAAFAADDSKYPEWRGQWRRPPGVGIQWDPTKPLGPAQQAPLTPEYQKVFEASMADQRAGVLERCSHQRAGLRVGERDTSLREC